MIGPYDLSASLGHIGEVTHPEVRSAIDAVAASCHAAGVRLGIFGISADAVRPYMENGFTLITVGVDSLFLGQAAAGALTELREDS
ncbi:MAG: aldolase/citrate lyase family protein [Gammaproteobacteria bacterium]|nr:aldolase/citrate lyase family protein [Gammaproteobacteria bacterium]